MKRKNLCLKIFSLLIMVISLSFCLCGCAEVNFVTYHNSDGTIHEYVHLMIDEYTLRQHDYQPNQTKIEIRTHAHAEASQLLEEYQNKIIIQYQNKLIDATEYTSLFDGVKIIEQDWNENKYIIGFEYKTSTIYKKYYELMNNASFENNTKEIKKPFYTKTYYYGTANYGDYSIFNRIYNYYTNSKFATISPQETNLTYSYTVSTKRFHSDADKVILDSNGNYIHTWNIDPNEPARPICFYTISANRSMWILVCIAIGLLTTAVLGIVGLIIYRKNNKINKNNSQ